MAVPMCPRCENKTFSIKLMEPSGSSKKMYGICCSKCGSVVGVREYFDVGTLVHKLAEKLRIKL
jgi:hypothetical protein